MKEWSAGLAGLQVVAPAVVGWDADIFNEVVVTLLAQAKGELAVPDSVVEMLEDVGSLARVATTAQAWNQVAAKCRDLYDLFEAERAAAEVEMPAPPGSDVEKGLTEDRRTVDDMPVRPDFQPDEGEAAPRTGVYRATEDGGQVLEQPWIVVKSEGGPYDDDAFAAGVVCGQIQEMLSVGEGLGMTLTVPMLIPKALSAQVDLIAMRFGYRLMFPATWADPEYDSGYVKFTSEPPPGDYDGDLLDDSGSE